MRIAWIVACSLLVTLTPIVAQAKYVEVWNPQEAQLKFLPRRHVAGTQKKTSHKLAALKTPGRKALQDEPQFCQESSRSLPISSHRHPGRCPSH